MAKQLQKTMNNAQEKFSSNFRQKEDTMIKKTKKDFSKRRDKAIIHCKELIVYYERSRTRQRKLYYFLQTAIIVLGAATPVLILWTDLPKSLQALPSALASIAAGAMGVFHVHENWVISKDTAESLKIELLAFETRATELYHPSLDDEILLGNFVAKIEKLHKGQISGWSNIQLQNNNNKYN